MYDSIVRPVVYPFFILITAVLCLISCGDDCHDDNLKTFFKGQLDNEELTGDGVCFLNQDSTLLLRLLTGDADFYRGISISVPYDGDGVYNLAEGDAGVFDVYGLDAIGGSLTSNNNPNNKVDLTWDTELGIIKGSFEFECTDGTTDSLSKMSGSFQVQVGDITEEWQCGFLKYEPDSECCQFIRG